MKPKTTMPLIHRSKSGKKYFTVNGQRVYIESGVTKKEVASLYKLLKKETEN